MLKESAAKLLLHPVRRGGWLNSECSKTRKMNITRPDESRPIHGMIFRVHIAVAFQCERSTPQPKPDQFTPALGLEQLLPLGAHAHSRTNIT
jgi:hypothetical protein